MVWYSAVLYGGVPDNYKLGAKGSETFAALDSYRRDCAPGRSTAPGYTGMGPR